MSKNQVINIATSEFAELVLQGLSSEQKTLPTKFLYDAKGDRLFRRITELPEYYLSNCEFEILNERKVEIIKEMAGRGPFHLAEFGVGDGFKTKVLISELLAEGFDFTFNPIDISASALKNLMIDFKNAFPSLKIVPINLDYFEAIAQLKSDGLPLAVMFLGSNLGNFSLDESVLFLKHLAETMQVGDQLLIGLDRKKDPLTILRAYNDTLGVTSKFVKNLLERINTELGGEFRLDEFYHYPVYDPMHGEVKSYLVSKKPQIVWVQELESEFRFERGETIFVETSRKYSSEEVLGICRKSGFSPIAEYRDCRHYFSTHLWEKA